MTGPKDPKETKVLVFPPPFKVPKAKELVLREDGTVNKTLTRCAIRDETYFLARPGMKARRDRFIAEYVKDWRPTDAYIRAGGPATTASKQSWEYLHEPYVAQKIRQYIDASSEESLVNAKTVIMGLLREANYTSVGASHGARVSALMGLARILGIEKTVVKGDLNHNIRGGVMVVPVVPGSDEWEQLASAQQQKLKEEVRK